MPGLWAADLLLPAPRGKEKEAPQEAKALGWLPRSTSTQPLTTCPMQPRKGASFPDQTLLLPGTREEAAWRWVPGLIPPVPRICAVTLGKSFRESRDLRVLVSDGQMRPENSEGRA